MKKQFFILFIIIFVFFVGLTQFAQASTLSDNFNDGNADGWIMGSLCSSSSWCGVGNWRVENGQVTQDLGGDHYKFLFNGHLLSDQSVEAKVLWHDNGYAGLTIWRQNDDNWVDVLYPSGGGFRIIEKWCDVSPCPRDTNLYRYDYPFNFYERKWQTLRVDTNSLTGKIAVYLDGEYILTHTVGANTRRTGLSGFNSGNAGGSFDDFKITLNDEVKAVTTCGQAVSYGGQSYNTVQIGSQCWFKENLNAGSMIGNTEIPDSTAPTLNDPSTVSKWCYNNSSAYCASEGGLYTWAEANAQPSSCNYTSCSVPTPNQGICPAGWHIPTDAEFYTLENYLTTPGQTCDATRLGYDCSNAGIKLVLGGSSGFDAIGAGNHETTGATSFFDKREPSVHFWSSSPAPIGEGYSYNRFMIYLYTPGDMVGRDRGRGMHGLSVRCLADSFTTTPSCTSWTYSDWGACSSSGQQTRTFISSSPSGCAGGSPVLSQSCTYVPPVCSSWTYSDWSSCSSGGQQTRTVTSSSPSGCTGGSPIITQSCSYTAPTCTSWTYSDWGTCSSGGQQTRTVASSSPSGCSGGSPVLNQSCTPSTTTCTSWTYSDWGTCSSGGQQTRTVITSSPSNCTGGNPVLSQSCTPSTITCTSWTYSGWGACSSNGQQTRTIASSSPSNCTGGNPVTVQSCTYTPQCTEDIWECGNWGDCSSYGTKTRSCSKTYDCSSASTASPATSQSCTYVPPCTEDTWECEGWSECSPLGIKTRNCKKTYDCSTVETTPNNYQTCTYVGDNTTRIQHEAIIKSTVQLLCFNDSNGIVGAGSGTIISSSGVILTNKHVIKDRNNKDLAGCYVGFTADINNYPDFSKLAFILDQSASEDMALLKIYNGSNNYSFTDINSGNSQNLSFSKSILAYGYPVYNTRPQTVGDLIQKITFSSGDYSGDLESGYFKTTAMLEHGISGGGAYTEEGIFTGITSAGLVGETNTMGLILGINTVKNWINSTGVSSKLTKEVSSLSSTLDFHSANVKNFNATADNSGSNSSEVIKEEKKLITKIDNSLSKRMSGNILLQVEKKGEGWYVNPDNKKKYYLGRPADAFSIMRNLGLGIKHNELTKYLNSKFSSKLSGKILLDVEQNGEAYYVNPKNLKGYFLNRPADAFKVMRDLGLGITNADIRKIGVGEIK